MIERVTKVTAFHQSDYIRFKNVKVLAHCDKIKKKTTGAKMIAQW